MKNIREPVVAGMFYPSTPSKLKSEIQLMLDAAQPAEKFNGVGGIVSPHAGYIYSGKTAAYAFNAVANVKYKTVVIISPSHREYFPGVSIYSGDAFRTPLGIVTLNKEMIVQLTAEGKFIFEGMNGHRAEHGVEVQIPFLQTIMKDFSIVPIVLGDQRKMFVEVFAEKLAEVMDDETLIVASSDLSHFYTKDAADKLDSVVAKRITDFDYSGLRHDLDSGKCEACGGGAIVAMMKALELFNKKKSKVLSRSDSGDVTGDNSEVVGYLSAVVYS